MILGQSQPRTMANYQLYWDSYGNHEPELGGIYTECVHFNAIGGYHVAVSFRVGDDRCLGLLFAVVYITEPVDGVERRHYCFGQFHTNKGAKLFAQFALNHFIETETWAVCPSFQPIEYDDGIPIDIISGDEIISELI